MADDKPLDDVIRAVAKAGQLNHLTLAFSTVHKQFQAGFRDTTSVGYRIEHDPDPVQALRKALKGAASRRPPKDAPAGKPVSRAAPAPATDEIDDLIG